MKSQIIKSLLVFFTSFVLFHASASELSEETANNPEQVVKQLITAMAENNAPKIKAAFAEDATQLYGRWYARKKTGASFWDWLESDIIKTQGKVVEPKYQVDANSVIVRGTFQNNNGYRSPADFLFTVRDGKITSWTIRYN